jgi:hypothetical protein
MKFLTIEIQAKLRNDLEVKFVNDVIDAVQASNPIINKIRIARKTKSYGSSSVNRCKVYFYKDGTKELWLNLGKTSDEVKQDQSYIQHVVDYVNSPRITAFFSKCQSKHQTV